MLQKSDLIIDGSHGEGGGQIIRTSIAMSAITDKSVQNTNIRVNRPKPGLQNQHLEAIRAVATLCNAKVEGLELGSEEIIFAPGKNSVDKIDIVIPTAGSIGLVLQALLPPAFHNNQELSINIKGGATFGKWAPPLVYLEHVLLPMLYQMGYSADIDIKKHGFYPKGGAEVSVKINNTTKQHQLTLNKPVNFTKQLVEVYSFASKALEGAKVAQKQAEKTEEILESNSFETKTSATYVNSDCVGSGMLCLVKSEGAILGSDSV